MSKNELELTFTSLQTELAGYKYEPLKCLFEYLWNSFDAGATEIKINYILPETGIGDIYSISIEDNGLGWDFEKQKNTKTFLTSTKQEENNKKAKKSLPRGRYGRGRYVFIWIAGYLEILSLGQRLTLRQNDIVVKPEKYENAPKKGTKVIIHSPGEKFSNMFFNKKTLAEQIALEFCWLLKQNNRYKIFINDEQIDSRFNISYESFFGKEVFTDDEDIKSIKDFTLNGNIVIWKDKPPEWSSFFFLDENNNEISVQSTGMNKQKDNFFHSVYIISDFFKISLLEDDDIEDSQQTFGDSSKKKIKKNLIRLLRQKLISIRKSYLIKNFNDIIAEFEKEHILPNLTEMGIYDEPSFKELLKVAYTISPSLFIGRNSREQRFICATFAGLLSSQNNDIVKIVLEQLQDLSEVEKKELLEVLQRTTLSNIVKTIKEIDNRLQVIDNLRELVFDFENETLESKHLQKVLDKNFWIFGEQFRLFASTEGALKNTLLRYAKDVLKIEDPPITTTSRKEVDLFLIKTLSETETCQRNIIIEIKRPSKIIGKEEYDQIKSYSTEIMKESICNSTNTYWEFYLVGNGYDGTIDDAIENAKNHGEAQKGLTENIKNGRVKIYVRKWSDILEVEWKHKMEYLKEKIQTQAKNIHYENPQEIVEQYTKTK
ncbi:MAG: ATP-binding protein [Endomicrobium sp.]|nr:ATP-binding protein [Endomicrobium sp.]